MSQYGSDDCGGSRHVTAGDVAFQVFDDNVLLVDDLFDQVSNRNQATTFCPSRTGRWRIRFSVMMARDSMTESSG